MSLTGLFCIDILGMVIIDNTCVITIIADLLHLCALRKAKKFSLYWLKFIKCISTYNYPLTKYIKIVSFLQHPLIKYKKVDLEL